MSRSGRALPAGLLFAGLFFASIFFAPPGAADERILSYDSHIVVHEDSGMTVTETIRVRVEGNNIKRGIYREFPTTYTDRMGNRFKVRFTVEAVLRDGREESYQVERMSNGSRIKIGRKDVLLDPGEYTYTITYRTDRQVGFFENFDEIYWNAVGPDWAFPIDRATAVVELPGGAPVLKTYAYTGKQDASGQDYEVSSDPAGNAVFTTTRPLSQQEGFTVSVSFPKGYVREPTGWEEAGYFIRDYPGSLTALAWFAVIFIYYVIAWLMVGRDPAGGTIVPLYEPPRGLSPAAVRYIRRMGFDHKTFAAAVVNMAVKGYLTIEEEGSEYTLHRISDDGTPLSGGEKKIGAKLFPGGRGSIVLEQSNHSRIRKALEGLKTSLKVECEKVHFVTNGAYFGIGILLTLAALATVVLTPPIQPVAIFMSVWLSIWTLGCYALVVSVFRQYRAAFSSRGAARLQGLAKAFFLNLFALPFIGGEIFGVFMFSYAVSIPTALILAGIVIMGAVFHHLLKAPTLEGRRVMDQIEGFRQFLSVAEKERLEFLHPLGKTPELFEKYLPYALALDVENAWSERFADVLPTGDGEVKGGYAPAWYSGRSWSSLGAAGFASSLGSSMSSTVASSSTRPGSSSGSGGGGSVGGGGGGGGGGGW